MKGVVYKSTGSWYVVKGEDQQFYNARIKGVFKIDGITSTNPIAVGDHVEVKTDDGDTMIVEIYPRRNYINRKSPANKHLHHIIAANIDQSLLFATLKNPKTSSGFIDRFLVTAEAYHVPAIVVFNKIDIYKEKELALLEFLSELYTAIGYRVFKVSVQTQEGVEELKEALKGKTTLVSGHSGVGKSSFLNLLDAGLGLKTMEVSGWSGKGMHSTTFAEMFDIDDHTKVIDTPGMREFALVDISKNELSHYFPEMRPFLPDCQFNNCLHINEPNCGIQRAVLDGKITEERFGSYYSILETIEDKKWK
ncbi:ribosome small subunit-dependent GTPase A [Gynurincola endophyticus]|jgi:ribosome biogenesis GTPase|uniref:ribosome small subunit-dependent GTPase A n=1 Tax=Gynurincola endophyticus TaxID=2479004 RepID=UPI000F8CCC20|nr:ribosome small subunit-dependent GTPase A [Gynurincola endophyticus]